MQYIFDLRSFVREDKFNFPSNLYLMTFVTIFIFMLNFL